MDPSAFQGGSGGGFDFDANQGMQWGAPGGGQGPTADEFSAAMGGAPAGAPPSGGWGDMGTMSGGGGGGSGGGAAWGGAPGDTDEDDSVPLLEELEIRPSHIWEKTLEVLNPLRPIKEQYLTDSDLAGPLLFCLVLGVFLLFTGKVHFGYIYSFGLLGCAGLYWVLNLMSSPAHDSSHAPVGFYHVLSVFGYSLLPIVLIAAAAPLLDMRGPVGGVATAAAVAWCAYSAVRFFEALTKMTEHRWLLAYPAFLLYACFALITVF